MSCCSSEINITSFHLSYYVGRVLLGAGGAKVTTSEENEVVLDSSFLSSWLLEKSDVVTQGIFNIPLMCAC